MLEFVVAEGHEALQGVVAMAMTDVLGTEPKITGMNGWTDAALLQAAGIPPSHLALIAI